MRSHLERNMSQPALSRGNPGGFYFLPGDEGLSPGTPLRKKQLHDFPLVHTNSVTAIGSVERSNGSHPSSRAGPKTAFLTVS